MKKLMIAASAAVWATVGLAVDSSNVVGYTGDTTGADNNFVTIPFNAIGFNTSDIQQIKLSDGGASSIGWGTEDFSIWQGAPTVVEGSGFFYYDPSMDPEGKATDYYWGNDVGEKVLFSIAPGQGVVVNAAADLAINTSGEVSAEQVSFTSVDQNNFTGNPFPQTIDIQDIKISDGGAGTIGWGTEDFSIWQGAPSVVEGSGFFYYDPSMDAAGEATDYFWGDDVGNKVTYPIAPNQGVVVNCAEGLTITIDPPYSL